MSPRQGKRSRSRGGKRPTAGDGRKPASGAGKGAGRRPTPREAAQRLGLLVFGSTLAILFIVVAIAEGVGDPSIPSGDVILVEDTPGESGKISEADFKHALELSAAEAKVDPVPKPGDKQYEEIKEAAITSLTDIAWLEGQAEEMDISVSDREVSAELKKLKKQTFKTDAEYEKFLKEAHYTPADVDQRVKLQMLTSQIEEAITAGSPKPSEGEIEDYYEAAKASQYTEPESRDVRLIVNKEKEKVEQAKQELEKDDSNASWEKVAKKYSTDPQSMNNGGLRTGLTEAAAEEPLKANAFSASEDQLEGPLKGKDGFYLFEVVTITPEQAQPLEEVKSTISSQLESQLQQQYFAQFVAGFNGRWTARTFCAEDYTIERCDNFASDGRPAEANPACYEADPKGPPAEECPAPVTQTKPALPGSVDVLTPEGERLSQRPRPAGLKEAPEGAGLESIPGTEVVPPTE